MVDTSRVVRACGECRGHGAVSGGQTLPASHFQPAEHVEARCNACQGRGTAPADFDPVLDAAEAGELYQVGNALARAFEFAARPGVTGLLLTHHARGPIFRMPRSMAARAELIAWRAYERAVLVTS